MSVNPVEPKPWYKSKIVWLGIITTLLGVVPVVTQLANAYGVNAAEVGTAIIGILTVIIRVWFTDAAISR